MEKFARDRELAPDRAERTDTLVWGKNAVTELLKSGGAVDTVYLTDTMPQAVAGYYTALSKESGAVVKRVPANKLQKMCGTPDHQGVAARAAEVEYANLDDLFKAADAKGEQPFLVLCDGVEDPHNLGAIIRTANLAGAHGVIIPKHRAVGLTATVARTSAGALNFTSVAKVTNLGAAMDELKKEGLWFVCADMKGEVMYRQNLTGPIGLVIGNEGEGVSRLVREKCDFTASIPMKGDIDSLNASVAAGVLAYEIVRQRMGK